MCLKGRGLIPVRDAERGPCAPADMSLAWLKRRFGCSSASKTSWTLVLPKRWPSTKKGV